MASKEVDAAVFTSIHNIAYFSNYVYCSMGRPYALLVTPDSSTTVSSLVDGGQPWRRSHGDNIIYTDWSRDNFIASIKHVLGDNLKTIGVEMDHMNLQTHQYSTTPHYTELHRKCLQETVGRPPGGRSHRPGRGHREAEDDQERGGDGRHQNWSRRGRRWRGGLQGRPPSRTGGSRKVRTWWRRSGEDQQRQVQGAA